jgi:hypothetical protein
MIPVTALAEAAARYGLPVTYPGDGHGGWGDQSSQGGWGQQSGHPSTGGFPQQGFGSSYGGLGVFGGDEPPPEKKSKRWLVIGAAVVVVLLVGGLVTWLVTRNGTETTGAAQSTDSAPAAPSSTSSSAASPGKSCKAHKNDWTCVPTQSLSYSYDVPKTWQLRTGGTVPVDGMDGFSLKGITTYGEYQCGGKPYSKGGTGGVVVPQTDLAKVGSDFAKALSEQFYKSAPSHQVSIGQPKPVKMPFTGNDGKTVDIDGVQVDAVTTTSGNECLATRGMVKVLVLKGDKGFHVFMANGDLAGGPVKPATPTEAELQEMVDSVKPLVQQ